ncbi:MAG: adenylate/guanylate cyclase domain-containing protein [Actinobacteria bacterium]|nr:adenylate/guanylate cyclase domain-containing protein [Actinomycetota bacterium]
MRRDRSSEDRLLATLLFTDIVGSTQRAAELGDQLWRGLLAKHHAIVRRGLRRFSGSEIDTTGDGFFARFDQPARAVACAFWLLRNLAPIGVHIRAGVHTGEVEVVRGEYRGIGVHIAARIMAMADAGDILVTSTARDLMAGAEFTCVDRGEHELKGVPTPWRVYAVEQRPAHHEDEKEEEPQPSRMSRAALAGSRSRSRSGAGVHPSSRLRIRWRVSTRTARRSRAPSRSGQLRRRSPRTGARFGSSTSTTKPSSG